MKISTWWLNLKDGLNRLRDYFVEVSGGKRVLLLRRIGIYGGVGIFVLTALTALFGPKPDRTFYGQTSSRQKVDDEVPGYVSNAMAQLFINGKKKQTEAQRADAMAKQKRTSIRYFASQLIGPKANVPRSIQSGAKLVGFLLNAIDTRAPSPVRVRISQGGEVNGVEIAQGSVLSGQFSYPGDGDQLYITFSRIDTPEGEPKRIQAQALNAGTYTPGILGESHSDSSAKTAAQVGLTMFAGMTDVLTEKESLGATYGGVQAKPTMKNALLQGLSRSAQDRANQTASEIGSAKDYLIVPEGKEMIIELTEDFK